MRRKKRQSRLSHYQQTASGELIYTGDYQTYVDRGTSRKKLLIELWCLAIAAGGCLLAGGFLPVESFRGCGYVLLPYMVALLSTVAVLWYLGELTGGGEPLKTYIYESTVLRIPRLAVLSALGAVLCVLGQAVRCAGNGSCSQAELLFLLLEAVGALLQLTLRRILRNAQWRKQEKQSDQ